MKKNRILISIGIFILQTIASILIEKLITIKTGNIMIHEIIDNAIIYGVLFAVLTFIGIWTFWTIRDFIKTIEYIKFQNKYFRIFYLNMLDLHGGQFNVCKPKNEQLQMFNKKEKEYLKLFNMCNEELLKNLTHLNTTFGRFGK